MPRTFWGVPNMCKKRQNLFEVKDLQLIQKLEKAVAVSVSFWGVPERIREMCGF